MTQWKQLDGGGALGGDKKNASKRTAFYILHVTIETTAKCTHKLYRHRIKETSKTFSNASKARSAAISTDTFCWRLLSSFCEFRWCCESNLS